MGVSLLGGLWYLVVGWLFRFGIGVCRLFLLASGWGWSCGAFVCGCLVVWFGVRVWVWYLRLLGFVGLRSICWFDDWCFWVVLVDWRCWFWCLFGFGGYLVAGLFARLVAYFCRCFLGDLFRLTARCCRYFGVGFVVWSWWMGCLGWWLFGFVVGSC